LWEGERSTRSARLVSMRVLGMCIEAGTSQFAPQNLLGLRGCDCGTTHFNLPIVAFMRVASTENLTRRRLVCGSRLVSKNQFSSSGLTCANDQRSPRLTMTRSELGIGTRYTRRKDCPNHNELITHPSTASLNELPLAYVFGCDIPRILTASHPFNLLSNPS